MMISTKLVFWKWWILYTILVLILVWFSFALTDPNLVLSQSPLYWNFQQWMWRTFFDVSYRVALAYGVLLSLLWLLYGLIAASWHRWGNGRHWRGIIIFSFLILLPLFFSYNALSHDVFNYIFNAKMVLVYHVNPHVQVALDFPNDPWIRFMHNTHTAAPYGYGWTAISLIPSSLGLGLFSVTWWLFRLFSVLGMMASLIVVWYWARSAHFSQAKLIILLLTLSPYVLIEMIMNIHNDGWMMVFALLSVWSIQRFMHGKKRWWAGISLLLLVVSISIKLASVVLLPLIALLILGRYSESVRSYLSLHRIALFASGLFFLPLLTPQSQWFHPWYLVWSLIWLPLMQRNFWFWWLVGLMISSTYSYLPWMITGNYDQGLTPSIIIIWLGGLAAAIGLFFSRTLLASKKSV